MARTLAELEADLVALRAERDRLTRDLPRLRRERDAAYVAHDSAMRAAEARRQESMTAGANASVAANRLQQVAADIRALEQRLQATR